MVYPHINGISKLVDQENLVDKVNDAVTEAPADGSNYARNGLSKDWTQISATGGGMVAWIDITGKPLTFPPTVPIAMADITGLSTALAGKEPLIAPGDPTYFFSGNKTWAPMNKNTLGLGNVDNTSDVNKPVSAAQSAAFVDISGDAMTGNLSIAKVNPALFLNKAANLQDNLLVGLKAGANRWAVNLGSAANETGFGTAGSDFSVLSFNDDGTPRGTPLAISRASGLATVAGDPTAPLGIATKQYADGLTTTIAGKVSKGGDSMSGNLTIAPAAISSVLVLQKPASGQVSAVYGTLGGNTRWGVQLGNGVAEAGANAGSNFSIDRYADSGNTYLGSPFTISRATGDVTIGGVVTSGNTIVSGSGVFQGAGATIVLQPALGGSGAGVYLRPIPGVGTADFSVTTDGYTHSAGRHQSSQDTIFGSFNNDFYFRPYGVGNNTNQVQINANGTVLANNFYPSGPSGSASSGFNCRNIAPTAHVFNIDWNVAGPTGMDFYIDGALVGSGLFACDYRIKKDIVDLPSTWGNVKNMRPVKFKPAAFGTQFADGDEEQWGLIAHELQAALLPSAATGTKDMANGVQSPNPNVIIAALTKALQEAMARIEALEAKVP